MKTIAHIRRAIYEHKLRDEDLEETIRNLEEEKKIHEEEKWEEDNKTAKDTREVFKGAEGNETTYFDDIYIKVTRHKSKDDYDFPDELRDEPCFAIGVSHDEDGTRDSGGKYLTVEQAEQLRDYLNKMLPITTRTTLKAPKKKS